MKKLLKRAVTLLLATAMVLSISACAGNSGASGGETKKESTAQGSTASSEPVVIKFLHKWPEPERAPYWEGVVADFEKENPGIKVQMEAVADDPIKEKLRVMLGGGNVPDVFFTWNAEFLDKFVRSGAVLDIGSYMEADTAWRDSFVGTLLDAGKSDEKQYGIPIRVSGKFFVYNKEKFAKVGVTEPPKTWSEFTEICEKLKAAGEVPIVVGNQSPWVACHYLTTLNSKCVPADVLKKDYSLDDPQFTDPGYVKALDLLRELNDKGYFNEGINSTQNQQSREMFYTGTGSIIYDEMPNFKLRYESKMPGQWGWFACPDIDGGTGNQNLITGAPDMFVVSAKSKYPEESIKFLKFLTKKENQEKFCKELGFQSCVKGAVNEDNSLPEVIAAMKMIEESEGMATWLDTAMEASVADKYLANLQEIFNGKSSEDIMKEVRTEAQRVAAERK